MRDDVLNRIRDFFINSSGFNGILLSMLCIEFKATSSDMDAIIKHLVKEELITLAFASHSANPHIKRLPDLSVAEQLDALSKESAGGVCAYPSADVIRGKVDLSIYDNQPFTRRLALAEAQLTPIFFDLDVLDKYYRDPRYQFEFHDYVGSISISTEHYESPSVGAKDKILLQSFGIGYDRDRNRVVVAYPRYLADLSPEHQQIWQAHVVSDPCTMNSDYARTTISGDWPVYRSAYEAFVTEQAEINKLAQLIGKPNLFKESFEGNRPEGFAPMLRPTRQNFDEFIHLIDKMVSENINQEFFKGDVKLEQEVVRDDGAIEIQRCGTLQLLEEWIKIKYRAQGGIDVSREVLEPFRTIRKLRQKPAHALRDNQYDRTYPKQQDDILGDACTALTKLRLILWSHPLARERYTPPDWLDGDKIVFY